MPKPAQGRSMVSGLVDSDSDDQLLELSTMPTPDSAAENQAPLKKGRGKAKAAAPAKSTKPKAPARRASTRIEAKEAPAKGRRRVLAEKTNQQETEDVDEFEQDEDVAMDEGLDASVAVVKVTKAKTANKKTPAGRGKAAQKDATDGTEEETASAAALNSETEKEILETQLPGVEDEGDVEVLHTVSRTAQSARRQRSQSRPRQPIVQHRRAGSASDTERSDPALRRKLGEMTKKYETLNAKYQDLREIGVKEAERNFERLKKQSEEKTAIADKLIATLKAEVASQSSLAKESRGLKKKIDSQLEEMAALEAQLAQMKASLDEAQAQNKTLTTKLAANRNAAASIESVSSKGPSSTANSGVRIMGTAEAAQAAQAAQLKEDLYSDLTGLIIRSVKREAEEDTFDCIQTGRNGSLHFKMATPNEAATESYDDAQCQYAPQLDPSRDKALMEILPDYLVEEITFPRPQAAKFYARVVKTLTEKLE